MATGQLPLVATAELAGQIVLLVCEADSFDQAFDLSSLFYGVLDATLEVVENIEMLTWGKQVEVNVVLWTNSQELSNFFKILNHINAEDFSGALCRLVEPGKHRDERALASSIVSKHHEYLVYVQLYAYSVDSLDAIWIGLHDVGDLHYHLELLHLCNVMRNTLVIVFVHVFCFKLFAHGDIVRLSSALWSILLLQIALPVLFLFLASTGHAVAAWEGLAVFSWDYIVEVDSGKIHH